MNGDPGHLEAYRSSPAPDGGGEMESFLFAHRCH